MLDLTGYSFVASYDGSRTALTRNTEYIVLPYWGYAAVYKDNGAYSSPVLEVSSKKNYPVPMKFRTPSSQTWYIYSGHLYKK